MENFSIIEKKQRLLKIMNDAKGNSLDIYYVIYQEYLLDSENPEDFLKIILEFPNKIGENDGTSEKISTEEEYATIEQYRTWLVDSVTLLVNANDSVERFYRNLWQSVFSSPMSPKGISQCAIILKILIEMIPVLPYYQATQLLKMDNDEFARRKSALEPRLCEALHMLNRHFQQRTEESSQLCRLGADLSIEDASVFWSIIISVIRNSAFLAGQGVSHDEIIKSKESNV